jgi:hypothetical protein
MGCCECSSCISVEGKISELVPRIDKCFYVLEDCGEKQIYFSGINVVHFMWYISMKKANGPHSTTDEEAAT